MDRDNKFWVALAVIFTLANAVAAGFYARAEPAHGFAHAAAMVFGTWLVWWLATPSAKPQASLMPADKRLEQLQQAVDSIAVEVERIGESQRYSAKVQREEPRG